MVRSCIVVECLGGAAGFVCPVVSRKDNPSQKYKVQYPARNEVRESTKVQTCKCTNVQTYKRTNVQTYKRTKEHKSTYGNPVGSTLTETHSKKVSR